MKLINAKESQTAEKLMGIIELSEYLGFRPSRIRYEVFMGSIPYLKIGRSVRFLKSQIDEWLVSKQKVQTRQLVTGGSK